MATNNFTDIIVNNEEKVLDNMVEYSAVNEEIIIKEVSPRPSSIRSSNSHTKLDKRPTVTFSLHDGRDGGRFSITSEENNQIQTPKPLSSPTSSTVPSSEPSTTRSPKSSVKKNASERQDIASSFMRNDSILIRVKPGQTFTDYAPIVVESLTKNDPRLGTLGELRHHLRTGTKNQVCMLIIIIMCT